MKQVDLFYNPDLYENFRKDATEHDLWYNADGTLSSWYVAFHGLGFKSYEYAKGFHLLSDADYTWFMLKYS